MSPKLSFTIGIIVHKSRKAGMFPVPRNCLNNCVTCPELMRQSELKENKGSLLPFFSLCRA